MKSFFKLAVKTLITLFTLALLAYFVWSYVIPRLSEHDSRQRDSKSNEQSKKETYNVKEKYAVNWSDDQTSILTITYDGGKTKTIKDYGLVGTFGLNRVYDLIFKLRDNQQWR